MNAYETLNEEYKETISELSKLLLIFLKAKNISGGNIYADSFIRDFDKKLGLSLSNELKDLLSKKFNVNEVKIVKKPEKIEDHSRVVQIEGIIIDFKFEDKHVGFVFKNTDWFTGNVNSIYMGRLDHGLSTSFYKDSLEFNIGMPERSYYTYKHFELGNFGPVPSLGFNVLSNLYSEDKRVERGDVEKIDNLKNFMKFNEALVGEATDKDKSIFIYNLVQKVIFMETDDYKDYMDLLSLEKDISLSYNKEITDFISDYKKNSNEFLQDSLYKKVKTKISAFIK